MLGDTLCRHGHWLFRWRGQAPFVLVPLVLLAIHDSAAAYQRLGAFADAAWELACVALAGLGVLLRAYIVGHAPRGTSGRNTSRQEAATLNVTGMYSVARHPLYLANFLIFLGLILFPSVVWFACAAIPLYWLYYERIMLAEEEFLAAEFGAAYRDYAARTPAVMPNFRLWTRPAMPFCLRTVLRREYSGLLLFFAGFAVMEMSEAFLLQRAYEAYLAPGAALAVGLALFLALRTLKRHTLLLRVEGR